MNKLLLTLALGAITASAANAQIVLGYRLSESQGSLTPLTDATTIYTHATQGDETINRYNDRLVVTPEGPVADNSGSSKGFDAGIDINIGGVTYRNFLVTGQGYLILGNGTDDIAYNTMMQSNFMTYGDGYTCVGLGVQRGVTFNENTKFSYKAVGTGNDARLVVEFEHLGIDYDFSNNYADVTMQLSLYADGNVSVCFTGFSNLSKADSNVDATSIQMFLGMRQNNDFFCAAGNSGELKMQRNDRSPAIFPATTPDGTTVTFTAPGDCVTPTGQPTDLQFTVTSTQVDVAFTGTPSADTYLAVYTNGESTAELPVNGTVYAAGDKLGDATVAYYGPAEKFTMFQQPGGTVYDFTVYAANSYGYNGPVYNTESPLTAATATLPAAPASATFAASTLTSITLDVVSNEANDDVVVVYTPYCERNNFGDRGLVTTLGPDTKTGDVLPAPEDYTPYYNLEGAPMPENGGIVAFAGKVSGAIAIENLKPGTAYFVNVYTRGADGSYTSDPIFTGNSTLIEFPYDGNSYNFPRYEMPFGWNGSTGEGNTLKASDAEYWDRKTLQPSRGTQPIQINVALQRGDAINGKEAWVTPAPVVVNERHLAANFSYSIVTSASRFETSPYNDWAEGDLLEVRVSEDNGESWTPLTTYSPENHPSQAELTSYSEISADLSNYRGKTVLLQLYWKTFAAPAFGGNMYIDRFTVTQGEFPAVPEVTVGTVSHETAVINWVSQQTDYQLEYRVKGSEQTTTVDVNGANTYTLTNLEANTEYEVRVRGVLEGDELAYSEWSDTVEFTTADYPEVDAPENLVADVETDADNGNVVLTWDAAVDALSYEVAYRLASSTEWIYVNCEETTLTLTELEGGENYIAKVRAFCTHDRETEYSAQVRFTAPRKVSVEEVSAGVEVKAGVGTLEVAGAEGLAVRIYNASGATVAATASAAATESYSLAPGLYVVAAGPHTAKAVVR